MKSFTGQFGSQVISRNTGTISPGRLGNGNGWDMATKVAGIKQQFNGEQRGLSLTTWSWNGNQMYIEDSTNPCPTQSFYFPVEIRDPISGKTVPESSSLCPDLVCPIWLIYLLPENTGHQVEHLFFISFPQEINSTQRERACKHCQKSYRITQYSRHVTMFEC